MSTEMKVRAIAPWFGGKRTLASEIVPLLGKHTQYFEPFCGSMAVLFAKEKSQKETVCDLHGDLINLARVLQDVDSAEMLYGRLACTLFSEDLLQQARTVLDGELLSIESVRSLGEGQVVYQQMIERAYWYFLASWMGRNGTAGTARLDYQIAVRWTKGGGSPTVRFRNAIESIPAWHERLRNVVILNRDSMKILDRFEDCPETAIYADPPYMSETRSKGAIKNGRGGKYLHDFEPARAATLLEPAEDDKHARLAEILRGYQHARIVVSYYDCPRVRELYEGWTFIEKTMNKQLHAQNGRGARKKEAPEVLIVNEGAEQ